MRRIAHAIRAAFRKPAAAYAAVFLLSTGVFSWIEAYPSFRDPDSFYHAKMAALMLRHGVIREFPWLPFTTLATSYADHHFLYHLALVPFVAAFGPFVGVTVATVMLAAGAVTAFFAFLKDRGVRFAGAYTALLATTSGFLFRVNLAKATGISIIFVFIALILMRRGLRIPLFFLSLLYVWAYGGWPILFILCAAGIASRVCVDAASGAHPAHSWTSLLFWKRVFGGARQAIRELFGAREIRNAFAVAGGCAAGIVINPFFPLNVKFYWEQIVQIAVVGYGGTIGVGSEWYPYKFLELFGEAGGVFILSAVCLLFVLLMLFWEDIVIARRRALPREEMFSIMTSFIIAAVFFLLTLRSRRHIEYFVPFGMAFGALVMNAAITRIDPEKLRAKLAHVLGKASLVAASVLVFLVGFLGMRSVNGVHAAMGRGFSWERYSGASDWLARHSKQGEVVFHSDWDEFPMLFFHDDRNAYVAGLDPTFLYLADPVRYRQWVDITIGKRRSGIADTVRNSFGARYVFIDKAHTAMRDAVAADPAMRLVYEDSEAWIYAD